MASDRGVKRWDRRRRWVRNRDGNASDVSRQSSRWTEAAPDAGPEPVEAARHNISWLMPRGPQDEGQIQACNSTGVKHRNPLSALRRRHLRQRPDDRTGPGLWTTRGHFLWVTLGTTGGSSPSVAIRRGGALEHTAQGDATRGAAGTRCLASTCSWAETAAQYRSLTTIARPRRIGV